MSLVRDTENVLINAPCLTQAEALAQAKWIHKKHAKWFPTVESAEAWLYAGMMPKSQRWAFFDNGKCGTSTIKAFLFYCEFGVIPTSKIGQHELVSGLGNMIHKLPDSRLARRLLYTPKSFPALSKAIRLAIVRDPIERAISGFNWLCKSQEDGSEMFSDLRLELSGTTNFDWRDDMYTTNGFSKFLDFIELEKEQFGSDSINNHFRPQVDNIKPDFTKFHLLGKTENIVDFMKEVAARLEVKITKEVENLHMNKSGSNSKNTTLLNKETKLKIETIFSDDFEAFGY